MQTKIRHSFPGRVDLIAVDPSRPKNAQIVFAGMTLYEGTGLWSLVDVRLTRTRVPNPYFSGYAAEDAWSSVMPSSPEHADLIKSFLLEYQVWPDGAIHWCPYNGFPVAPITGDRGLQRTAPGFGTVDQTGYFSRADGLSYLKEAQKFWDGYEGEFKNDDFRLPNPRWQESESELLSILRFKVAMGDAWPATLAEMQAITDHYRKTGKKSLDFQAVDSAVQSSRGVPRG